MMGKEAGHCQVRTTFFTNLSHHKLPSVLRTDSTALWLDHFFWASRFLFLVSSLFFFVWFRAADSAGYCVSFWAHVNILYIVSYRISPNSVASGAHCVKVVEGVVAKKFTFAIVSPGEFLLLAVSQRQLQPDEMNPRTIAHLPTALTI